MSCLGYHSYRSVIFETEKGNISNSDLNPYFKGVGYTGVGYWRWGG